MMRKSIFFGLLSLTILFSAYNLNAAVYEASTLHNSVSRSETVQDLFFKRWEIIEEKELYLDFYGKINWVPDFKITTVNKGTQKKETVDMRLIRTYGSITVNYPVFGGYEGTNINDRLTGKTKKKNEEGQGLWKPKNLILGLTATGFHYGLTSHSTIYRGSAGVEVVSDYKYAQFFDDILALSLLYRPYFVMHFGIVINNEIEPNDDGTMDYFNSTNSSTRYFMASNLFSFLNMNAASTKDKLESISFGLEIRNAMGLFMVLHPLIPKFTLTYKMLNLYNDEPYDAVWVNTSAGKSMSMSDSAKESARLHTFSIAIDENINNQLFLSFYIEFQGASKTLIEKRNNEEVEFETIREISGFFGYNFFKPGDSAKLIGKIGLSKYWDVSIPVHRESEFGYTLTGGFLSCSLEHPIFGLELKFSYNYSQELRSLVETADKFMLEGSMYARI